MSGRSTTTLWNDALTLGMYYLDKSGKIADNIINGLVTLWYMTQGDAIKKIPGAPSILVPVYYQKSSATGFYRGRQPLDITPQDGYTNVEYQWKQHYATVSISGLELGTAGGPDSVKNLANGRFEQSLSSAKDSINTSFYGDGSASNYMAFTGLAAQVPENGQGALGDIDSAVAANSWWRPNVVTCGSAAANLRAKMDELVLNCRKSRVEGKPSLILGTTGFYLKAEDTLRQAGERYLMDATQKKLDMGLAPLVYKGIPIEYDFACPLDSASKDQAYVLNFRYFKWHVHRGTLFRATKFIEPMDQDAFAAKLLTYGEFVTNNRRHLGLIKGVTA